MTDDTALIPTERIAGAILRLREQNVMLDSDLAGLYDVETKALVRAVQRNRERFPEDFMFRLTTEEFANLRCHFGTSSSWGGRRYLPYAFTEHGIAMLSSVLNSPRAVQVNIAIMRAFMRMRRVFSSHEELARRLEDLAARIDAHDEQLAAILGWIRDQIAAVDAVSYRRLGYRRGTSRPDETTVEETKESAR